MEDQRIILAILAHLRQHHKAPRLRQLARDLSMRWQDLLPRIDMLENNGHVLRAYNQGRPLREGKPDGLVTVTTRTYEVFNHGGKQ